MADALEFGQHKEAIKIQPRLPGKGRIDASFQYFNRRHCDFVKAIYCKKSIFSRQFIEMNKAVIFDMDGLLVDSEPLWWQAGVEVMRTVGVNLDDSQFQETMGLRTDVALQHWFSLFPWTGKTIPQIEQEVNVRVIQLIAESAEPLPGVFDVIHLLSEQKIPMGLCSSSPHAVIEAVLSKLNLQSTLKVAYSAEDEPMGKPHPGAYLSCAKQIGVHPHHCIAFEDSLYGAIAAKAAGMKVVAVPSSNDHHSTMFDFCDRQLRSLTEFNASFLSRLLQ
jgi:sugar-phosphatase